MIYNAPKRIPTILIATGTMNAGGTESLIMEILRRKSNRVNYVLLIHYKKTKEQGVYDKEISELGIPIFYVHAVGYVGKTNYIREFVEVTKQIGHIDILHSHLNAVGGIIAKAAKKAGIKNRIVHCHADIKYRGSIINRYISEAKLLYMKHYVNRYATENWACSQEAAKRLFKNPQKAKVIPNIIYVPDYLPDESKTKQSKSKFALNSSLVLGSVGRIARIKNYELVIRVINELNIRGLNCEFICFGRVADELYFSELTKIALDLNVENYIHFVGNSSNIPFDIRCIDVFLMPSFSEGFGMAALEAQASGIPVIVSEGIPPIVDMGLGLFTRLALDNKLWADQIQNTKKIQLRVTDIISKFNEHGYNSETAVHRIEDQYLKMSTEITRT